MSRNAANSRVTYNNLRYKLGRIEYLMLTDNISVFDALIWQK